MSDLLLSLVVFAVVATSTPGGATTLATASGAQFGFKRSLPLLGGIAFGHATLIGAVGGGLGTIVQSAPQIQIGMRIAGSLYLLWLAWTIGRIGKPTSKTGSTVAPMSFAKGFLLLWLNPKAWTMAIAAASAYAGLSDNPSYLALIVGTAFGLSAVLSLTLWCLGGQWLARILKTENQWRAVNISLGLILATSIVPMWW
jgi:threonine/homoserine/homoserine lactone efflux protein